MHLEEEEEEEEEIQYIDEQQVGTFEPETFGQVEYICCKSQFRIRDTSKPAKLASIRVAQKHVHLEVSNHGRA